MATTSTISLRSTTSPSRISSFGAVTVTPISSNSASSATFIAITTFSPEVSTIFPSSTPTSSSTATSSSSSRTTALLDSLLPSATPTLASAQGAIQPAPPFIQTQALGGVPVKNPDAAASVLALILFFIGFFAHIYLFKRNKSRGRYFPLSLALAFFCFLRLLTVTLRIAWALKPTDAHLALTAGIFVTASTLVLYIVNGICSYRIVRSQHPRLGDSIPFTVITRFLLAAIIITLTFLIVAAIQFAYTLNPSVQSIDRNIQRYGTTFYTAIAFLPVPVLLFSHVAAHRPPSTSKFGPRCARRRLILVLAVAALLTFRAGWICATTWPALASETASLRWYLKKPVFYLVSLLSEVIVVYILLLGRMDKYFYIGPHGTFEEPSSERSTPSNNRVALTPPPMVRLPTDPKSTEWSSQAYDEEGGRDYSNSNYNDNASHVDTSSRQRYPPGMRAMSPVSEERLSSQIDRRAIVFNLNSHESLKNSFGEPSMEPSGSPPSTVSPDKSPENFSLPPPPNTRLSRGPSLSLVTTFPDANAHHNSMIFGGGRSSIAFDQSTGLYHLVSAPLMPANGPLSMTFADSTNSLQFDPEAFDITGYASSVRHSRASSAIVVPNSTNSPASGYTAYKPPMPQQAHLIDSSSTSQSQQSARSSSSPPHPLQTQSPHSSQNPPAGGFAAFKPPMPQQAQLITLSSTSQSQQPVRLSTSPPQQMQTQSPYSGQNPPLFRPGSVHSRRRSSSGHSLGRGPETNTRNSTGDRLVRPMLNRASRTMDGSGKQRASYVSVRSSAGFSNVMNPADGNAGHTEREGVGGKVDWERYQ